MVELVQIHPGSLGEHIHEAFRGDWALINTYHLVNGDLAACVKSTFKEIDKVAQQIQLNYWAVQYDGKSIGFTVTGHHILLSFGINLGYRSKDVVMAWWTEVKKLVGPEFVTWLFEKNTRAIDFLKRNGMVVEDEKIDDGIVTLVYAQ